MTQFGQRHRGTRGKFQGKMKPKDTVAPGRLGKRIKRTKKGEGHTRTSDVKPSH